MEPIEEPFEGTQHCDGAGNVFPGEAPLRFGSAGAEPKGFTWFESFTEAMLDLESREEQVSFVMGIVGYGAYGIDPLFTEPTLKPLFRVIKPIIDTNNKRKNGGSKGGRPNKSQAAS